MAGMVLFFFNQLSPGNILGNIFGILAGVFLALMFVMVGKGGDDDSTRMSGILIAHAVTMLIGIPAGIIATATNAGAEFFAGAATVSPLHLVIIYILILGVFQLGIPYVLYGIASKECTPLACSLIGMLEPLLNPVWVAIFIGEVPGFFAYYHAVLTSDLALHLVSLL